jgi:hypothetical protein
MKTAFNLALFLVSLVLVSCEKAVIVPRNNAAESASSKNTADKTEKSSRFADDNDNWITDPNDRNLKTTSPSDMIYRVTIVDPTDNGNISGKKTKR